MTRSLIVVSAVAAVALAGCGSGTTTAPAESPAASAPADSGSAADTGADSAPGTPTAPGVPALSGNPTDLTKESSAKAGSGQPPTKLVTHDVVVGKGAAATLQNTVDVRYSGTLWTNGQKFDSSWSRGDEPTSFPLDGVVPGFAQGIAGMKPGGRRVIVIPPNLGYGDNSPSPTIPPGSTLVFVVDLVKAS